MKVLTVRQPWAWAIAAGVKRVENRTWLTAYRGPVAIHAARGWSQRGAESPLIRADWHTRFPRVALTPSTLDRGDVLAVAHLVDAHECVIAGTAYDRDCCADRYAEWSYTQADGVRRHDVTHLVLADVIALDDPVPHRGTLGLRDLPTDVDELVHGQAWGIATAEQRQWLGAAA